MKTREQKISQVTIVGSAVNALLTIGKIIAGVVGHSGAMLADGLHSLSDFISDIIVLVCVRISAKGRDDDHDYGHGKYETLATLCVGVLLLIVGGELFWDGAQDIRACLNGHTVKQPETMALWAALISILAKEVLYHYTAKVGKEVSSPVVIANAWHHRTDALSSVGSAAGIGGAILLGEKWVILDPIACCCISVLIVVVALRMIGPSLNELLEISLPADMENDIMRLALEVDGVKSIHNLKTRKSGPNIIIDAHVVVDPDITVLVAHDISTNVEKSIRTRYGKETQISIHIEPSEEAE
ncbi:MAG: cation diffusion facilitator family transporter [Paludibacteraceae bacterium]|nr:cation diffusion facilitator family transporter [Paludibacteraceae bacterium]